MLRVLLLLFLSVCVSCNNSEGTQEPFSEDSSLDSGVILVVLGTIQDAGSPHIACRKSCCKDLFEKPDPTRKVVSLGIIDHEEEKTYLLEATPDMPSQLKVLKRHSGIDKELPDGIFLTHAHIGHYIGLMYLGREATNAQNIPVFAMPGMQGFLEENGPWSQLVNEGNIRIVPQRDSVPSQLSPGLQITPFRVPHRDEYSETVGYLIEGPNVKVLFIPDIDKWEQWQVKIEEVIRKVDYAFVDATFYHGEEINTRDISEIPHPFIIESMERFERLPASEKKKIHFIHFNHTNPVLDTSSDAYKEVTTKGFAVATFEQVIHL